jgi:CubicO group peptidase (beta-lactamase class C family)
MVEAASGQRLDRYMTGKIFAPLGMADTGFAIGPAQRLRKARMHTRGRERCHGVDHEIPQTPEFHMGGGGLYSTVSDYLKFTQALLDGRRTDPEARDREADGGEPTGEGVLCRRSRASCPTSAPISIRRWHEVGPLLHDQPDGVPGRRAAGSLAWGGLANSYYWIDPVKKVTGVVGDPAPAVLRPEGGGRVREFRAGGVRRACSQWKSREAILICGRSKMMRLRS